jgi:cytochrome b561
LWRTNNPTPPDLSDKRFNNAVAKLVKIALYSFLFIVFVSGYLITTAEGKPAAIFDVINIPALTELSADNVDLAGEIHEYLAWCIIILALLHAGGALMHHFVFRDRTLVRMLKPVKKSDV